MSTEITVEIINGEEKRKIKGNAGEFLSEILRRNGLSFALPCGGNARCGSCRIRFLKGAPSPGVYDERFLTAKELEEGKRLLCRCIVVKDCSIAAPDHNSGMDIAVTKSSRDADKGRGFSSYAVAVDIGTTTIAAALIGLSDDKEGTAVCIADSDGRANSQRIYGTDVISRIAAAADKNTAADLHRLLVKDVEVLVGSLVSRAGIEAADLVVITGNTTMLHFFAGYDTQGLGRYPYTPVTTGIFEPDPMEVFSEKMCKKITVMPGISAFVGADIVAGLYSLDVLDQAGGVLFADLGTNGELAFWDGERLKVTSTAAGPVFEAGNISCGMPSVPGAVCHVTIDEEGRSELETIGGKKPGGLCGTGVLETVSELVRCGICDETGLLKDKYFEEGFLLAPKEGIRFTQKDIRQVQLAKAAVAGGIKRLLEGSSPERIYIAGGFGSNMDTSRIKNIRMFPESFDGKMILAGNTALDGAVRFAGECLKGGDMQKAAEGRLMDIRQRAELIELAGQDDFDEDYIASMNF